MKITDRTRKNMGTIAFCLAGLAVYWLSGNKVDLPKLPQDKALFYLNSTASLPQGLYMRIPTWTYREGDYVAYTPTAEAAEVAINRGWLQENGLLLKKIGALPGDEYAVSPHSMAFSIQRKYIGQAANVDRQDNPMPVCYGRHIIPSRHFLPIGTSPRSFDGRYTGAVPMDHIQAKVIPLITNKW